MIVYLFNNNFPDNAGFGKRCLKEIEILSEIDEVVVICKKKPEANEVKHLQFGNKKIEIVRFTTFLQSNQKITSYKFKKVFYEIVRNLDLVLGMTQVISNVLWKNRTKKLKLYVVVSPLTVPLIGYLLGKIFSIQSFIVEFHDLEPELAMHIKNLSSRSFITRVEFYLEKLICKLYTKIVVTTQTQAERLIERNDIGKDKILVIPNSIQVEMSHHKKLSSNNSKFVVGYVSSFTYTYSVSDLYKVFELISMNIKKYKNIQFVIIGSGSLLNDMKKFVQDVGLSDMCVFMGNIDNVSEMIQSFDVALVPWSKNYMTETMAPTKLFEYMNAKKPIIAPNYGEFKTILSHSKDSLLYDNTEEVVEYINQLHTSKNTRDELQTNVYKKFTNFYKPELYFSKLKDYIR